MVDVELLPQNGRVVLVVLQDGRQLEGELRVMSGRYELDGVMFDGGRSRNSKTSPKAIRRDR